LTKLDQLRQLLLSPEQDDLRQQQAQIETLQRAQRDMPQRLPEMLEAAQAQRGAALQQALAPVVAAALSDAVRRDRHTIVDALFPIIGPTIRKAIAEALRGFVVDLNRALDHSLTARGLAWRLESWRSGVPFAQVVMKHTLRYRIDHLFLIERESGLLLHRYSAPQLPDLDADAIAGMLTAIGDFVRDSVQAASSEGGLASATVGEHLLQVYEGPVAVLACFVRGVPPLQLAERLHSALEQLHRERDALPDGAPFDWETRATQALVVADLNGLGASQTAPTAARWPLLLISVLLVVLICGWIWQRWQHQEQATQLRQAIAATPGWVLLDLRFDGVWHLRALRDPDAPSIEQLRAQTGLAAEQLIFKTQPYLALDDALLLQRAKRILTAPAEVQLRVANGVLLVSGAAQRDFAQRLASRAWALTGISKVDSSALQIRVDAQQLARLHALKTQIESQLMRFARGAVQLDAGAQNMAIALAAQLTEAILLAEECEMSAIFELRGWSDDGGSASLNATLRANRAQALAGVLMTHSVPANRIRIVSDERDGELPSVSVRVVLEQGHG